MTWVDWKVDAPTVGLIALAPEMAAAILAYTAPDPITDDEHDAAYRQLTIVAERLRAIGGDDECS